MIKFRKRVRLKSVKPTPKTLYIIRGIPGSGKTSLAHLLVVDPNHVVEADDFFTDPLTGVYEFEGHNIGTAHRYCADKVEELLRLGQHPVAVSNTSLRLRDVQRYTEMAQAHGYTPFVIRCENDMGSVRGVPEDKMRFFRQYEIQNVPTKEQNDQ